MIYVVATTQVKPDQRDAFIAGTLYFLVGCRPEPGKRTEAFVRFSHRCASRTLRAIDRELIRGGRRRQRFSMCLQYIIPKFWSAPIQHTMRVALLWCKAVKRSNCHVTPR